MSVPSPTRIVRFVHVDTLAVCLHAPNNTPNDGLTYRTIHNVEIQAKRQVKRIPCGPRGRIHD